MSFLSPRRADLGPSDAAETLERVFNLHAVASPSEKTNFASRSRYLWPLIHYHKFIAKCIKKLKRNGIDVKTSPSSVCRFLRQEVCHVSDHLARMSKYDSEEWTAALCHFDGWTESSPEVNEAVCRIVSGQKLVGVRESTDDACSSLLRSQIGDTVLKAMQSARDEAGRDAYAYKDAPTPPPAASSGRGGRGGGRPDEARGGRRPPRDGGHGNNCNVSARDVGSISQT